MDSKRLYCLLISCLAACFMGLACFQPVSFAVPLPISEFEDAILSPSETFVPPRDTLTAEALRLLNQGKLDPAIAKARQAISQNPDSAAAFEILGAALVVKGDIDDGLENLKTAIILNPNL